MKTNCQSSGTCLGAMKLCLAIVVCLSAIDHQPSDAASCSAQTNECVESVYTLATCNSFTHTCGCVHDYNPIPTGCAAKLSQPRVTPVEGRSTEFFPGAAVQLICVTNDFEGTTIEWRRNGKKFLGSSTTAWLTIDGPDSSKTYSFSCLVRAGAETSELSDPVTITEVAATGPKEPPVVVGIRLQASPGATIPLHCDNRPFGATYKWKIGDNPALVDTVTHNTSNGHVACVLDSVGNFTANMTSRPQAWFTRDVNDIENVMIRPSGNVAFRTGTPARVFCLTVPENVYLQAGGITYIFQDSGTNSSSSTESTYNVQPTAGNHTISCFAKYRDNKAIASGEIQLEFTNDYVKPPVLSANSPIVAIGSRLVLTCVDGRTELDVEYSWDKNGQRIARQRDRIIQFGNFQEGDAGRFTCTATRGDSQATSNEFTVTANANSLHVMGSTLLLALVALASSKIL